MKNIIVNIENIENSIGLHEHLKDIFDFPYYYGKNLDALYDCLTDIAEPVTVMLPDEEAMYIKLGSYGKLTLQVFLESSFENPNLLLKNNSDSCL